MTISTKVLTEVFSKRQSIFVHLFGYFVSSNLLIIILAAIFYYQYAWQATEMRGNEQVSNSLRESVALFKIGYQSPIESNLRILETAPSLNNFLSFQKDQATLVRYDIEKQFSQLIRSRPAFYRSIRFVDSTGLERVVVDSEKRLRSFRFINRDEDKYDWQRKLKSTFALLKSSPPQQIIFSQPFRNTEGNFLFFAGISKLEPEIGGFGGAVFIECDLSSYIQSLANIRTHGYPTAWLLTPQGEVLSKPAEGIPQRDPRIVSKNNGLKQESGIVRLDLYPGSILSEQVFLSVVLSLPKEIFLKQNQSILKSTLLIALIAVIFTLLVAWRVARKITNPVTELVKVSQKFAGGNYSTRSLVMDNSEIGELSLSFNYMAETLEINMQRLNNELLQRRSAENALQRSHESLELILNSTAEGIFGIDKQGLLTFCNASALSMLGYTDEKQLVGRPMHTTLQHSHTDGRRFAPLDSNILKTVETEISIYNDNEVFWRTDQQCIPIEYRVHPVKREGKIIGAVISFSDISQRQKAAKQLQILSHAVEQSPLPTIMANPDGNIHYVNKAQEKVSRQSLDNLIGLPVRSLFETPENGQNFDDLWRQVLQGHSSERIIEEQNNRWQQVCISPLRGQDNSIINYLITIEDITERKLQEHKITYQAHHDVLTGLPNRFLAMDRLERLLKNSIRHDRMAAVLFIDLDDFKKVNDLLGHEMGDKLLVESAHRLKACLREADTVGRLGGDEFIVLLADLTKQFDAGRVAENILETFRNPFKIGGHELLLTASIGIATFPNDSDRFTELLRLADIAMYESKQSGRNNYQFFTEALNTGILRRLEVEEQLHHALIRSEFYLVYQPIVNIQSMDIAGAEVLLRWNNELLGAVSPEEFIPIAEHTGLINIIGDYVLCESIAQMAKWQETYQREFKLSVNVSPRQLHNQGLFGEITSLLKKFQLKGENLQIEITEGVLMSRNPGIDKALRMMHEANIKVAMDDFGTGYSSLSYLRNYPFDSLKIDRTFVSELHQDNNDRALVIATIDMSHALGIKVVAEGIETNEQLQFLVQSGCEFGQGYLFSKPVVAEEFEMLLVQCQSLRQHGRVEGVKSA